jgi:hypothetical protein
MVYYNEKLIQNFNKCSYILGNFKILEIFRIIYTIGIINNFFKSKFFSLFNQKFQVLFLTILKKFNFLKNS